MRYLSLLLLLSFYLPLTAQAQSADLNYVIYSLDNQLYAQAMGSADEVIPLGTAINGAEYALPDTLQDVYDLHLSPLSAASADGFGFHHGVWSADHTRLAYLEIRGKTYRVQLWENGASRLLLERELTREQGYLDPLGWTNEGMILLSERHLLYHLDVLRVFQLDPTDSSIFPYANAALGSIRGYVVRGQSALFSSGDRAFIGFEVESSLAYVLDFPTQQVVTLPVTIQLPRADAPAFERYPIRVLGMVKGEALTEFINELSMTMPGSPQLPAPFLHWALPDANRRVTCYPDSSWTRTHFNVTCPVLGTMYEGHQGTDVGGQPNGLPLGTNVYATAPGVVVLISEGCGTDNPSCGRAYGNYVMLEHTLVVDGSTQTWYTGYAHLSAVYVQPFDYVEVLNSPIAASGASGLGGPHLHIEVRTVNGWVDPWDSSLLAGGLWIGGDHPLSAEDAVNVGG